MYLTEVKIKNFRGFGENLDRTDRYFVFDQLDHQLVVFHGFNGHGKTSFFEAIEWCLTDTVARLEKLYRAENGGAYSAHDLNRSHYLKFSASASNQRKRPTEEREISVELTFDNGTVIVRTSMSQVLAITESSGYESIVQLIENGQEPRAINNKELLEYLAPRSSDAKSFVRSLILAQDGITDFVRRTSPEERKSLFMRYLQQEDLSNHIAQLRLLLNGNGSSTLVRKKREYESKRSELICQQARINSFLQNIGYDNFEAYKERFQKLYTRLTPFVKRESRLSNLSLKLIAHDSEFQASDYPSILQGAAQVYELAILEKEILITQHSELELIKTKTEMLDLLLKTESLAKKDYHANILLNSDVNGILTSKAELESEKLVIGQSLDKYTLLSNKLITFEKLFESLLGNVADSKNVNVGLWEEIDAEFVIVENFIKEFQEILDQKHVQVPDKDSEKLILWKNLFETLDGERQFIQSSLKYREETKNRLSSLNTEYKETLNQVKTYINLHSDSISSCPICLNDDFSSNRYKEIGIEVSANISDLIISIIDKTIANGDNSLEELSKQEAVLRGEVSELSSKITTDIISPLKIWLASIHQQFLICYSEVKLSIEHSQRELWVLQADLIQREREIEERWERIKESTNIIFGSVELIDIKPEKLNEIQINKNQWFEQNLHKLGFEHEPNLEELAGKIVRVRSEKGVEEYLNNDIELAKQQKSITRSYLMVELLKQRLEELLKLKVPREYIEFFKQYEQLDASIQEQTDQIVIIDTYLQLVRAKHSELVEKQNQILGDELHGHPVIAWVYNAINPHTQYRDLKVIVNQQGTHFISEEIKNNLYLDQIFSQAQINILALSTFLGIGLTQRYSHFDQLFLDDPIQSMDDVNVLAFIDVLRAILDSHSNKKRLIISTHDDNFAELLAVKMRNKKILQYFIEGYGPEGPVIRKN